MKAFVVNLARRPDRRQRMQMVLPAELEVEYTTDWPGPRDGASLDEHDLGGYALFPWQIDSDNPWWCRPLKKGEIGCAVSHWLCWQRGFESGGAVCLYFEDDVCLVDGFLTALEDALGRLTAFDPAWDLLYLGRHALEPDRPALPGIVRPGFSYCTYAYALSRAGAAKLLASGFDQALIPADELLPALYLDHPRPDVRRRYPKLLSAYACEPPLVTQLSRELAGTDTEASDFVGA